MHVCVAPLSDFFTDHGTDFGAVSQRERFVDAEQAVTNAWSLFCTLRNSLPDDETLASALHAHARALKQRSKAVKKKAKSSNRHHSRSTTTVGD